MTDVIHQATCLIYRDIDHVSFRSVALTDIIWITQVLLKSFAGAYVSAFYFGECSWTWHRIAQCCWNGVNWDRKVMWVKPAFLLHNLFIKLGMLFKMFSTLLLYSRTKQKLSLFWMQCHMDWIDGLTQECVTCNAHVLGHRRLPLRHQDVRASRVIPIDLLPLSPTKTHLPR